MPPKQFQVASSESNIQDKNREKEVAMWQCRYQETKTSRAVSDKMLWSNKIQIKFSGASFLGQYGGRAT